MTDHDWAAIYSVVLASLEDCDPPGPGAQLSDEDRDRIAETVSDHLSAALADGKLGTVCTPKGWRRLSDHSQR